MNTTQSFEEFIRTASPTIGIWSFLINLGLAATFSFMLGLIYVRVGQSLSNRATLAQSFVLIGVTTMLIITIVKSSLALSLGLVGALSIVRFRTAIKEPEELSFLFLTIAIGLGFGAGQSLITVLGTTVIFGIMFLRNVTGPQDQRSNLYLTVEDKGTDRIGLSRITATLKECCSGLSLTRFDESEEAFEAAYLVTFDGPSALGECQ